MIKATLEGSFIPADICECERHQRSVFGRFHLHGSI